MLKIRCTLPLNVFLIDESRDRLSVSATFSMKDIPVTVSISPTTVHQFPEQTLYFSRSVGVDLVLDETAPDGPLARFVTSRDLVELARFLTTVANRMIVTIRNFGIVPHLTEFRADLKKPEELLERWRVEFSKSGSGWETIVPAESPFPAGLAGLGGFGVFLDADSPVRELRVTLWPDIAEALQDGSKPPPEREFLTNSLEHLRLENFRLALLEATICLEIVLTQYLRTFLKLERNLPRERVDEFLSPQIGLTARVSGILPLTLGPSELENLDIPAVLAAIGWRNAITHKTGNLPEGIPPSLLNNRVNKILSLSVYLGRKRDQLAAGPDFKEISSRLATEFKVIPPSLSLIFGHHVVAEFTFLISSELPEPEILEALARRTGELLTARDDRFNPSEHLSVRFMTLPRVTRAMWFEGRLVTVASS